MTLHSFWTWIIAGAWILTRTVNGVRAALKIPDGPGTQKLGKFSFGTFLYRFLRHLAIIAAVSLGVQKGWLGIPWHSGKITWQLYLISPLLGWLALWLSSKFGNGFLAWLQARHPKERDLNLRQYDSNMTGLLTAPFWMRRILATLNGISEELLMRVFLLGVLTHDVGLSMPVAIIAGLVLSAVHHMGQGRALGPVGVTPAQLVFSLAFVATGEVGFVCAVHVIADWIGYLSTLQQREPLAA